MTKATDLKEAFLAEFGEKATQSRTGKLLGFTQHDDETTVAVWSDQDGPAVDYLGEADSGSEE